MILCRQNLKNIHTSGPQGIPDSLFSLPEKVLQFGTGVLLRGLPDYFIDKANRQGLFNGRVIVVKSTDGGDMAAFEKQDGLYTLCIRGLDNGKPVEENIINASISRVLSARSQWDAILECASLPDLKIIISNTTEVGLQLVKESINQQPPVSYPAKLLAFLFERFRCFHGVAGTGMVIIPTELIVDNGKKLKSILLELASFNELEDTFIQWLQQENYFCSSLVDRIVPGKPEKDKKEKWERAMGYQDELMTVAEVYRLWAIEGDDYVRSVLSFAEADEGVVIAPNIDLFRELKLRMLNATHTLSCGIAFLSGFETVKQAMHSNWMSSYINNTMMDEIAPSIPYDVDIRTAKEYGAKVLDRFRNEYIEHHWINITLQYTSKLRMRVVPVLKHYYQLFQTPPLNIATGFAAWLLFMRSIRKEGDHYLGICGGIEYPIKDDSADLLYNYWIKQDGDLEIATILRNADLWGGDLDNLPGFTAAVREKLDQMLDMGVDKTIQLNQTTNITS
jgi:tagaturonate reductase